MFLSRLSFSRQLSTTLSSTRPAATSILLTRRLPQPQHHPQRRQAHTPSHLTPKFSSSVTDPSSALSSLAPLLHTPDAPQTTTTSTGKWTLTPSHTGLQRTYRFKTFKEAWGFMCVVAERCAVERHHPEWFNCYNEVKITWTTHRPRGLSEKDISMAKFCDEKAGEMGAME
ncbi:hypothetical protein FQN54_002456 [Arachnomyces sp. PD_36]|nr:hypothetical protein FQN54_002456 [Arachnomyces sp. PD_36]